MHSLCCVEIFSLPPLEHFLLKTLHMLRWSRPYRAKTGNSPEYTSPSRHWSRARLKTKANKTIPSSQDVYNQSFFVMDANLQPLRYFVIKSIFSASRPPPQYCASAPQKKRQVMVDERHVMTQHISNIAWCGDLRISYLQQQKFKLQVLKIMTMSTFKRSAPE